MLNQEEITIIGYIALGCSDKYIAKKMCSSLSPIKRRIAKIYRKLGAINRPNAVFRAYQRGLIK